MREFTARTATGLVVLFGLVVALVLALKIEGCESSQRISECSARIGALAKCFRDALAKDRFDARLHGSAQILSWLEVRRDGDEKAMFCPTDPSRTAPTSNQARVAYRPKTFADLTRAVGLGSYAVRDFEKFPLDPGNTDREIILCDRQGDDGATNHHKEVLVVAYSDGGVEWLTKKRLGIREEEPIVVGPKSKTPELRAMEKP